MNQLLLMFLFTICACPLSLSNVQLGTIGAFILYVLWNNLLCVNIEMSFSHTVENPLFQSCVAEASN